MTAQFPSSRLDKSVAACLNAGTSRILTISFLMIGGTAFADWSVGLDVSLGILYVLPMVLAATVLSPRSIISLALICSILRGVFETPHSALEVMLRFAFAFLAYVSAGLFVVAVIRNRQEQTLRAQAEEQLKTLIDSSPAGILTLDAGGTVLAANTAANTLFSLAPGESMKGKSIESYLPVLSDALQMDIGTTPFRTAAQSQGRRENGELFLADTWFSTYPGPDGRRLAAIVIDSSEEMRAREEQSLRQLSMNSRIMAGAMLHEIRNLCTAISVVYSNVGEKAAAGQRDDLQALDRLVQGLAGIASMELRTPDAECLDLVPLKDVLNDLRIILEPSWAEADGFVRWELPDEMPRVLANRHGLLQVFLNLSQNSQRAVQGCPVRELTVSVSTSAERALVRFQDSGSGVRDPQRLFQPFQPEAESTGLGLYISRSLLRSYGGELRFEPQERGSAFIVDVPRVAQRTN